MKYKKIFFVGIKGVGMTSLAVIAKEAGISVSGSDVAEVFITDAILEHTGIKVLEGFDAKHIDNFFHSEFDEGLVITTGAHGGLSNEEVIRAKELGIPVMTHGMAVGFFMSGELFDRNLKGVSVAGSHGKTTTSAMIATVLSLVEKDPSYAIGTSEVFPLGFAGHYGEGEYFVAEADEYASDIQYDKTPKLFYQKPDVAVITNIDFDHPDFYQDLESVYKTFDHFLKQMAKDGMIIVNGDDDRLTQIAKKHENKKVITFGVKKENDYYIENFAEKGLGSEFDVYTQKGLLGRFSLAVPGLHNAVNMLAAIILLIEEKIEIDMIKEAVAQFRGTKRRLEIIGETTQGAVLIDDYAHHPKEIETTLIALRKAFPNKKIVSIFQPHMVSRTKALLAEFVDSFKHADALLFLPVFTSAREKGDAVALQQEVEKAFDGKDVAITFPETKDAVIEYINQNCNNPNFVIVTIGAGDVYKIGYQLKQYETV